MIVGLGLAAQLVHENLKLYSEAMKTSRDKLWELLSKIDDIRWLSAEPALPNTLLISIPGKQTGAEIIQKCGGKIFASTGAACHSEKSASAVLTASQYVKISKLFCPESGQLFSSKTCYYNHAENIKVCLDKCQKLKIVYVSEIFRKISRPLYCLKFLILRQNF